jgi:hypothetical protein
MQCAVYLVKSLLCENCANPVCWCINSINAYMHHFGSDRSFFGVKRE